jgi:hypothetical protein
MDQQKERLMKLIQHWAEHNDEHLERFREASEEAAENSLPEVSMKLKTASMKGVEVSKLLRECLGYF